MNTYTANEVRKKFKEFMLESYSNNKVVYITNYRKPMAALVPVKYAKIIEELILKEKETQS